ncbi:MAG: hypothetical protein KC410_19695 [Anaerolineales bacterium]|nr:hypothetical protein [Anaerolineales bacterium]
MDERDLVLVAAAFDTLLEVVLRECGTETVRTVLFTKEDVLAILSGKWNGGEAADAEPEDAPDVERCPACRQSVAEIQRSFFACPTCYATFGDDVLDAALPF